MSPDVSGRAGFVRQRRARVRIRQTRQRQAPLLSAHGMSRAEALRTIRHALRQDPVHPLAGALIDLFQVHAEELTELGLSYEGVKVLEQTYPLLRCLKGE